MAAALPHAPTRRESAVPVLIATGVAATFVVGLIASATGTELGSFTPPLLAKWAPGISWLAPFAALALAAAALAAVRLRTAAVSPVVFAALAFALALPTRVLLSMARNGTDGWYSVFGTTGGVPLFGGNGNAKNEYLAAIGALDIGLGPFLDRFAEVVSSLPVHAAGHPPGFLTTLYLLGIDSAPGAAALAIVGGALVVPLTYVLARGFLDEPGARTAALLCVFATSALLFGATSADALYAALGVGAAAALVARRTAVRTLGPLLLALATFFSWALLAIGAWAVLVVLLREGWRRAAILAAGCAVALAGFYALLFALTGFDPLGAIAATEPVYRLGIARLRPYAFWLFGSPAAFLVALGLPVAWYALKALAARRAEAIALAGVVVTAAVLGFTKAETERIWLFFVPLACVAAASVLPARLLPPVLALLVVQALAAELLFSTIW